MRVQGRWVSKAADEPLQRTGSDKAGSDYDLGLDKAVVQKPGACEACSGGGEKLPCGVCGAESSESGGWANHAITWGAEVTIEVGSRTRICSGHVKGHGHGPGPGRGPGPHPAHAPQGLPEVVIVMDPSDSAANTRKSRAPAVTIVLDNCDGWAC
jgi:hypothetical protein